MAGHRSTTTLPLRLQQILSGGRSSSPTIKLESEPPPKVKAFIDRVIKSPLHDIAIPLSGFRWEYNKGNFHHWRPLFMHFDTYFKTYISSRNDLLLADDFSEEEPFPKHSVMQILRVMQIILENCHNKGSFGGLEHFKLLLASTDPEILIATLETLCALVRINPAKVHLNGKSVGFGSMNSYLLCLAQGWGSKEEGLGLHSCIVTNERNQDEGLCLFPSDTEDKTNGIQYRLGSTLFFECNIATSHNSEQAAEKDKISNLCVIKIPDLHLRKEDDIDILKQCIDQYNVAPEHRFSLLTRIRYAHAFRSPRTCRLYSKISILALIALVQSSDANDDLVSFFANEPEYTNELIRLVKSEDSVPVTIRALAMLALGAQLAAYASSHERARILSGSSIISAGGNRMVLLSVLQKAIFSLSNPSDPSTPLLVDALLQFFLLHVLSSSSSGSAIRGSGMVPPLLPLLQDTDPSHMHLVCSSVKVLQKLMEYSSPAVSLFKDLGGVDLLAKRLHVEAHRVIGTVDENTSTMITSDLSKCDEDHLYNQKRLIKALLKALGSATYSPANAMRFQNSHDGSLPASLSLIFRNVGRFGGDIYFSAVTVMSEIIHRDPTCFALLDEMCLPESFLSSVVSGVLPSAKALICVPNGLGAICLNTKGLEAVKETDALRFLIDVFTTRKYLLAINEGVVLLANAVEELLRHVQPLKGTGVDIIIEIINKLATIGLDDCKETSAKPDENIVMEMDLEDKASEGRDLVSTMDSAANGMNDEQFLQLCVFHTMVLVHRTMENSETCRLFVDKGGIEALLKLLLRPVITQPSDGMSIALHSAMVFKSFTQHHSAPLARAFSSSLREHLRKALSGLSSACGSLLSAPKTADEGIFSSLFVVEFLLFLAASKDSRWISALLTEFGDPSKDVLQDIGNVHREVIWQLALLEDSKVEVDTDLSSSRTQAVDSAMGESDDQRVSSFRQHFDLFPRRRMSGWNVESQYSELIRFYFDLGRAASGSQGLGIDGLSALRLASSSQSVSTNSSDVIGSSKGDEDKKRSFITSCREMMRSLSHHINHLFVELGKAMVHPRRENIPVNLPPSSISVVNTTASIVLEHLNFGGHANSSDLEVPISTKCRYLGRVIDFIDVILFDIPESCNPITLNCFYGRGVIQAIATTFEATSQLLFAVNMGPNSPMDTDDKSHKEENEEVENFWLYGPLASYGMLMDHLATSSYILSSSTKQLLEQPIASVNVVSSPRDGEAFIKMLQSKVLKAVLPIWANPHLVECNMEFISTMISIIKHVYSGVEVRNVRGSSGTRLAGPPPDESTISLIVDMGFSRARAEEALRQVGTNSVEIATDWLFSHPEEPQEDAELARALAMSLGNSDSKEDEPASVSNIDQEEDSVQLPPIDDILSTCTRLLQAKESLAFPVRDLLVMISSQNDGQNRAKVLSYLIDHAKQSGMPSDVHKESMLSALFHVLALILHEDTKSREVASEADLVKLCLDMLSAWNLGIVNGDKPQVPKWVTACFLSIERMFHVDPKLAPDLANMEHLKKDFLSTQNSVVIEENKKDSEPSARSVSGFLDINDQKRLIEICCRCIRDQLPSEVMHVVLQLSSSLTKVHSLAVWFLDNGGFHALLNLPTSSLFSGFNNIAAAIIRHILEDPNTLQQAMELEIRHSIVTATSRHSNPGVTPRNFAQNLAPVISRDPLVFMKAAQAVCQVEMFSGRPYIVLLKDREKDKSKEKASENDKLPTSDVKVSTGDATPTTPFSHSKQGDFSTKISKNHKKSPQSFTSVIEYLLDMIASFVPPSIADDKHDEVPGTTSSADMDVDSTSKGKGKAIALSSEDSKASSQDSSASLAKAAFILKLLTEILLTYASSIHVLLRRDAELSSFRGAPHVSSGNCGGGIFHYILHMFLPYPGMPKKDKKTDGDWRYKLATRANQFLVSAAIRSSEGRKRIFTEINNVFSDFIDSSSCCKAPTSNMHAFVDLLNEVLAGRSPTGSYILAEASVTFVDVGLVRSLTRTLQVLDLDNADSPKVVTAIVKALESVTKEYVHSSNVNSKGNDSSKIVSDQNQVDSSSNGGGDRFQGAETMSQPDHNELVADHMDSFNTVQNSGSSDFVADDMDRDRDLDGGFTREVEDDFMHEASEDGAGLENGISTVEIRFDIPRRAEDDNGEEDDDEDMSGDDGEEVDEDEDDEEHNDLEEDEVHHMSHTDHDDHEIDDEEFDEDVLEDDDEEDDDDDGVILRVEEGFSGFNVLDQIEVLGGNNLPNDTLRVMPIDIFGSRRQGRTSSIYNILGRAGDFGVRLEHPLLEEPSSLRNIVQQRQSENTIEIAYSDRNHENTSRVDTFLRTLRSGRHGHRFSMWSDDTLQRGGSSASAVPQGIEDLLVSHLRRPASDQAPDQNISNAQPQEPNLTEELQIAEAEVRESGPASVAEDTENMIIPSPVINSARDSGVGSDGDANGEPHQEIGTASASEQVTDMQYERSDATARDVEAVSQASSGSGGTLGESLRSLEVEIGSVDGHDDGDRQAPGDRLPLTDMQPATRARRSSGVAFPVSNRDISLESANENLQNQMQEGDPSAALNDEQQAGQNIESDSIDPTFLEALPEDLRAEVLSSRQNQVAQPPGEPSNEGEEIDPEFLAALPSDIREEVLAQQRAQRIQQSQELEGQPVEMDAVSIIATFPSDIREEVLLTSSEALLSTLTPALVAEANMLRERFAHRYHSGSLFGMNSRSRRGETSRRGDILGTLERNLGDAASRRSGAGNPIEADGVPLVDTDALKALIRLLRVVQPLYKGQLQRLLLNLCAHQETRMSLVKILMDILMLDLRGSPESITDGTESPFRLYGCQSYITYSRPQLSDGVPPLVSRRVLETLTYLARNHPNLSKLLLHLELPRQPVPVSKAAYQGRGKAVMMEEDMPESKKCVYAIVLLLSLLNQPLYVRSVAHLEQLLNLLEVIMINAENDSSMLKKSRTTSEQPSGTENTAQGSQMDANMVGSAADGNSKTSRGESSDKSVGNVESSVCAVLLSLPEADLRLLCSLLAREGLSDNAYVLVAEVLKKMVASAPTYCGLFITELAASVRNLVYSAMNELHLYENEKSLLSSSSTTGTAILRVLQALSSLVSSLHEKKDTGLHQEKDFADALSQVWEINAALESLWVELSNCISKIESSSETPSELVSMSGNSATSSTSLAAPLPAGTQNFLPYIESFFVTCEKLRPEQNETAQELSTKTIIETEDATASTSGQKSSGAYTNVDEKNAAFIKFSEKHRKLLNAFIRQNPGLLEKSFYLMLKVPRFIDFDNKRAHFRSKIKHQHDHHHSPVRISVRRAYILEDSYNQLRMRSHQELKGRLTVHFQGEEGIDAGGLTREWYQLLSRVVFDKGALLFTTVGNESIFQPNPNSVYQTEHLSYFKFVGRVVGKALFDGQLLDVHFTRSFYKHILDVKVTYHDIEAIDPDYYKNLKWVLENDINDVLDLTFSMDADEEKLILYERTEVTDCELIPGGRNIRVTEENKHEYVDRVAEHRLTTAIRPQINAFLEGFNELIHRDLISIFNDKELELLISGLPDIDLDDLRTNTEYSGYSNASPVIQWFWEVVQSFSKEDKARFLQFVTGTSKVPLEGFSALQGISGIQKFQIHKAYGSTDHLPSAHTCFNQLDLPEYTSKEQLEQRLLLAIHEGNEGFGFG